MIRLNLLPLKEAERALGRRQRRSLVALGVAVALLIMIIPFVVQGRRLSTLDQRIADLNKEIRQYNVQVKEAHDIDRIEKEVRTKLRIIEDLNRKRIGPSRVLDDLSLASPDNLWLIDFSENNNQATLTGMALDNETIARFMRQLEDSPYFHGVDLVETSRTNPQPASAGQAPVSFTRFIVKAGIDYFGRDGKPPDQPQPPAPAGTQAGHPTQEPKA